MMIMDSITVENFRCFRDRQTARLAPLTLLVGENSTGKTSFLAMVRVLSELESGYGIPDFTKKPYDLGSYDDIAHYRGGKAGRADEFFGGLSRTTNTETTHLRAHFRKRGPAPVPVRIRIENGSTCWAESESRDGTSPLVRFGTSRGSWEWSEKPFNDEDDLVVTLSLALRMGSTDGAWKSLQKSPAATREDIDDARQLLSSVNVRGFRSQSRPVFASAPVRFRPRRTYDPHKLAPEPEGSYIPTLFADMVFHKEEDWKKLKNELEKFGHSAGLFDEIFVRPLGKRGTEPFQVQVRKQGKQVKGPPRNLVDMGYGVSQVLPVVTELLQGGDTPAFLLQQPEIHLHPSAQAALGSLFCQIADARRQLIVETHSDYLLDRVRMDVRDGEGQLRPEDVSILYFDKKDLDVTIHSLRLDKEGNVLGAPPSYGQFFLAEVSRSVWKRRRSRGSHRS